MGQGANGGRQYAGASYPRPPQAGEPRVRRHLTVHVFLKLQLKHRDARPERLEKRYAAGPRCFHASSKGTRHSTPGMGVLRLDRVVTA